MDWRKKFLQFCGPGLLGGITPPQWRTLRTFGSIDLRCFPRLMSVRAQSLKNGIYAAREQREYATAWEKVQVQPPLFILGHWRSGTTLLHELLARDSRFAFPNSYQTSFPSTFLVTEARDSAWLRFFIPKTRPMDEMHMSLASPQEDEFALAVSTLKSPCLAWVLPREREKFKKYLTMRTVGADEIAEWKSAFITFVKKVQLKTGNRPLLLKSPPHTARIRLLLEMFPDAKFVHIHRDPYRVFASTRHTLQIILRWHCLQNPEGIDLEDWVLRVYREMYEAFFEERALIPEGRYREVKFEDLERDPVGVVRKIYRALQLREFESVEPALREYVSSLRSYRKNSLPELASSSRARVSREWGDSLQEWGYA